MEPTSAIGLLAAIVGLLEAVIQVNRFISDIESAPKERAKLAREISRLIPLFTDLKYDIEGADNDDATVASLRSLAAEGFLHDFKALLEELAAKLKPRKGLEKAATLFKWPFDKKAMEAVLEKIERFKSLMLLAQQRDQRKLAKEIRIDVQKGFQKLEDDKNFESVVQWLHCPNPWRNYKIEEAKRYPGTGEWFLQSRKFAEWKQTSNSFLWLHGIPGCGKTVLFSTILSDLTSKLQQSLVACAFYYFDFSDSQKRRTDLMLKSILLQLLMQCNRIPDALLAAYKNQKLGTSEPDNLTLLHCIRSILDNFQTTYLLLDALDECSQLADLYYCFKIFHGWKIDSLHLLTTSRKVLVIEEEITSLLSGQVSFLSKTVDTDISLFIHGRLAQDPKLSRWPTTIRKKIEASLDDGSKGGMFRWAALQLKALRKCIREEEVHTALSSLPKDLHQTYDRILTAIEPRYKKDVHVILQFLCYSQRPMRLAELVETLAVDLDPNPVFKPARRILDPLDILRLCSSLVKAHIKNSQEEFVLDSTSLALDFSSFNIGTELSAKDTIAGQLTISLAHHSVQDYLLSVPRSYEVEIYFITPDAAHALIAKICAAYLIHFLRQAARRIPSQDTAPLLRYSSAYWLLHYESIDSAKLREEVNPLLLGALVHESNVIEALEKTHTLHFGLVVEQNLIRYNEASRAATALQYLCTRGSKRAAAMMLSLGLNVNRQTNYGRAQDAFPMYALPEAVRTGDLELVTLLLDNEFGIETKSLGRTALEVVMDTLCEVDKMGELLKLTDILVQDSKAPSLTSKTRSPALVAWLTSSHDYKSSAIKLIDLDPAKFAPERRLLVDKANKPDHVGIALLLIRKGAKQDCRHQWLSSVATLN